MNIFFRIFVSFGFIIAMLVVLAVGAGIATFIEHAYTTQTAFIIVYDAFWYEAVMVLLSLSIISVIIRFRLWRKHGFFLLHAGFVVVLIGAGLTRYLGHEGLMHIRQGEQSNVFVSSKPYFIVSHTKKEYAFEVGVSKLLVHKLAKDLEIQNDTLSIRVKSSKEFIRNTQNFVVVKLELKYRGITKNIQLIGSSNQLAIEKEVVFGNTPIVFSWGLRLVEIPFYVFLKKFELEKYPGSSSPSSYASEILIVDGAKRYPFRIYMNNTMTYGGYKFFQHSYDPDELGTVLSLNHDPGTLPTYIGYIMLALGFLLSFVEKKSRFNVLRKFLNSTKMLTIVFVLSNVAVHADESPNIQVQKMQNFMQTSQKHTHKRRMLLVQDQSGRIKPLDSLNKEILMKLCGKTHMFSMDANQILLSMFVDPQIWKGVEIIKVKSPQLKKILGVKTDFVSFMQCFDGDKYILQEYLKQAYTKEPRNRNTFDKDVIKLDERVNVAYMVFSGSMLRIIPISDHKHTAWLTIKDILSKKTQQKNPLISQNSIVEYLKSVHDQNWTKANVFVEKLAKYQRNIAKDVVPSQIRVEAEVVFNDLEIFDKLVYVYIVIGILSFLYAIVSLFRQRENFWIKSVFVAITSMAFLFHLLGLVLRWWASGHAPWSDSYESLVYIAFSSIVAGLFFFRSSMLAFAGTIFIAGIVLFVAHLSWIDPQITNLLPVLKSFWLTIHVSVITASYAFLALGALLGIVSLVLMIFMRKNHAFLPSKIRQIAAINEISLLIGLALLTVGNFLGGVWANESWGRYWGWDPKETWAFISIVVYVLVLHLRFIPKLNSVYVFSLASVVGFSSIIMTYFGVNFYLSGLHSYATGEIRTTPSFVYISIIVVLAIGVLAFFKRQRV